MTQGSRMRHVRQMSPRVGVVLVLMATALLAGCSPARMPAQVNTNKPSPGGTVLTGEVINSPNMQFSDSAGEEVVGAQILTVATDRGSLEALYEGAAPPSVGSWVEVREGTNGRWFVTGTAEAPEPTEPVQAEPAQPVPDNDAAHLSDALNAVLIGAQGVGQMYDDGASKEDMLKVVAAMEEAANKAKEYRTFNTFLTPEQEATRVIDRCVNQLVNGAQMVAEGGDHASSASIYVVGTWHEDLEEWPELVLEDSFRVEKR